MSSNTRSVDENMDLIRDMLTLLAEGRKIRLNIDCSQLSPRMYRIYYECPSSLDLHDITGGPHHEFSNSVEDLLGTVSERLAEAVAGFGGEDLAKACELLRQLETRSMTPP